MNSHPREVTIARGLRKRQTDAEKKLWYFLKNKNLDGLKFKRQQPIGEYIVDFVCFERKLIIELDGSQHNNERIRMRDNQRTAWLESEGFSVIRFWDNDVLQNIEGVLIQIQDKLKYVSPSP